MKVVHFTNNIIDGAGKAAYRLHQSLLDEKLESIMIVAQKQHYDDSVIQVVDSLKNIDRIYAETRYPENLPDFEKEQYGEVVRFRKI